MALEFVNVKEEVDIEVDVIEGPLEESYTGQEVKCELEIEPEMLQTPQVSSVFTVEHPAEGTMECDVKLLTSCFVKLERLPIKEKFLDRLMKSYTRKLIFMCEFCGTMFQCRYQLRRHEVTHIKQLLREDDYRNENVTKYFGYIIEEDLNTQIAYYSCVECRQQFINEIDLSNHMQIHEKLKDGSLSQDNVKNLQKQLYPPRNMIACYGSYDAREMITSFCVGCCTVVRGTLDAFAKHLTVHLDENPVMKQMLKDFKLPTLKLLRRRQPQWVPTNKKERKIYSCQVCGSMFLSKLPYDRHMQAHTTANYPCEICDKVLPTPETLQLHKYEHNYDSFPPVNIEEYSLKKQGGYCSIGKIPTSNPPIRRQSPPKPASANEVRRDSKSSDESIDFQKSSLFSRLRLLNQTLSSNVVGKSSNCPK